jgi:transmembrane sensor
MILFKGRITIEILYNYLNGTLHGDDVAEIENWINASRENRLFFNRLKEICQHQEELTALSAENRKRDWENVVRSCKNEHLEISGRFKNSFTKRWIQRTAAAVVLFIFSALGYFAGYKQMNIPFIADELHFHEIMVPSGEKSKLILSDGTVMWINAGSKVKFPNTFNTSTRDIWLDGEAYFEVTKDEHRPFLVHTSEVDVKVYGTKFNLKAYNEEDLFEATLIEGLVSLQTQNIINNAKEEIFLEPNHKAIYLKKKSRHISNEITQVISEPLKPRKIIISNPVQVESSISWREGKLEFNEETFENMIPKLERRYGVIIQMEDKELPDVRYSGVLKNISIEQALKAIQMTTDFTYEIHENKVNINGIHRKKEKPE